MTQKNQLCRICGSKLDSAILSLPSPSITSTRMVEREPLAVFQCSSCFHGQKFRSKDLSNFYNMEYRISLESQDFDQLYDILDGKKIFRTDYQANLVLDMADIPSGANILDYGAGKAATIKRICDIRKDIIPYVFDVSKDYQAHWDQFVAKECQATYEVPGEWQNKFSVILAMFVLEHVEDPVGVLQKLQGLLAENGTIIFSVPNPLANIGDLLAIDHVNHFSTDSINLSLAKANLISIKMDTNSYNGAIFCCATQKNQNSKTPSSLKEENSFLEIAKYWTDFQEKINIQAIKYHNIPSAIFGAGVYGSFIASRILDQANCKCFLDNNPFLAKSTHMGLPVISPNNIPEDIRIIFPGLNPKTARKTLQYLENKTKAEIIYLD